MVDEKKTLKEVDELQQLDLTIFDNYFYELSSRDIIRFVNHVSKYGHILINEVWHESCPDNKSMIYVCIGFSDSNNQKYEYKDYRSFDHGCSNISIIKGD